MAVPKLMRQKLTFANFYTIIIPQVFVGGEIFMEKRKDSRLHRKVPVRFTYNGTTFQSYTGDISRRGVFIQTAHALPSRNGITIEVTCRHNNVRMVGFIVWSKNNPGCASELAKGGMGIQLLDYQKTDYQEMLSESD